ncbi:FtsX-like permease family protein [Sanguibacter suarezii]|uniref:FtsX-like permease family protein n=1 Tax=Sanguibacter suarezii TaxID=60921 RepID=UPI00082FB2CC|nr:FtsX-like permease family protein [Sanguibacter suarezii]
MRARELAREALASAWAQKLPTFVVVLLSAAMCLTTLMTVGRTAAANDAVQAALTGAGSRTLTIVDISPDGVIPAEVVDLTAGLSGVEHVMARTMAADAVNAAIGAGGTKIPTWAVHGNLDDVVILTSGRWPGPDEAVVADAAREVVGLDGPVGALDLATSSRQLAVVGTYQALAAYPDLASGALTPAGTSDQLRRLDVVATSSALARGTQSAVLAMISAPDPTKLTVTSPVTLAELQEQIAGDLTAFGASLLVLVLSAGAGLTALVVLADVLVRRKDLGRRRALGASRTAIIALVTTRTALPAALGALLGTGIGYVTALRAGVAPPVTFAAGTALLALLAATVAAVGPALLAAYRDPVTVLRTP